MATSPLRSPRRSPRLLPAALTVAAALAASVTPAVAQAYKVTLKNGNSFVAKYEPEDASYDSSKMVIVTAVGNRIALAKDDVSEVVVDIENRGFGLVLDNTTVVVGISANDAPGGEDGEDGEGDGTMLQVPTPNPYLPSVFSGSFPTPGFPTGGFGATGGGAEPTEPGSFSAGIPLSFVGGGLVPTVPPN